eukprot:CAMPEP_0203796706 /NCGR_PEP_ID=MMETSP0100_2-20121128/8123_1 /ASSEMBLY_ACC=CAM_ASM_000210 /TAXON_ID=96639 /ORGANISM=" , Strain NY0313808BC1" /LENGTH=193 /DNA_ID=CAMNT_0050701733 /DNA_START=89 /DNA_END=666 /DNA_ORIENTATION=+
MARFYSYCVAFLIGIIAKGSVIQRVTYVTVQDEKEWKGETGEIIVQSVVCICPQQPDLTCTNNVLEDGTGFIDLGVPEKGIRDDSVVSVVKLQIKLSPTKVIPLELQLYSPGKIRQKTYEYPTFKGINSSTTSAGSYFVAEAFPIEDLKNDGCKYPQKKILEWDTLHKITEFSLTRPVPQNITQWEHFDLVFP